MRLSGAIACRSDCIGKASPRSGPLVALPFFRCAKGKSQLELFGTLLSIADDASRQITDWTTVSALDE